MRATRSAQAIQVLALLAACAHLVMSQPNGLIQETVRAFLRTWYGDLVDGLPAISDGRLRLSREPGLGVRLKDGLPVSRITDRAAGGR